MIMKKTLVLLVAAVFALPSCGNLSSNSDQDGDDSGVTVVPPGNTGSPMETLEPSAQKKKLKEFGESLGLENFQEKKGFLDKIKEKLKEI